MHIIQSYLQEHMDLTGTEPDSALQSFLQVLLETSSLNSMSLHAFRLWISQQELFQLGKIGLAIEAQIGKWYQDHLE